MIKPLLNLRCRECGRHLFVVADPLHFPSAIYEHEGGECENSGKQFIQTHENKIVEYEQV